ncbi:MAG: hypothetical protein KA045_02555 [Burkholderiaceae bacterium]|jgi:hypothetical protein|nr:hypothetical protein [Betaproteobacteria bacterium]MBP7780402.1 hypothetical protein [Burkholderiaceae bacterium]
MSKFTKAPGAKANHPPTLDNFIDGATKLPANAAYEWENLDDKRRRSGFNLRFTDAELAKLKFIVDHSPHSMHSFCIEQVVPAIEAKIAELTGKPQRKA